MIKLCAIFSAFLQQQELNGSASLLAAVKEFIAELSTDGSIKTLTKDSSSTSANASSATRLHSFASFISSAKRK